MNEQGYDSQDPLRPHRHDPNLEPPSTDVDFMLVLPDGRFHTISLADLHKLPATTALNCMIVSTGHGTSGPFAFTGVTLLDFVQAYWPHGWDQAEVISADGFGNRVLADEIHQLDASDPILLAYAVGGLPLRREQGAVRMIVPGERDDALRQVKWIGRIIVK